MLALRSVACQIEDLAKPMDRAFSRAPSVRVITYAP